MVSHCSVLFKLWSNFTEEGSLLAQLPFISPLTGISPSQLPPLKLVSSRPAYQILWMHFRSITWSLGITLDHFLQKFALLTVSVTQL